jgi:hypothetical protein
VAYSCSTLICFSWVCHSDWQEQIIANANDTVGPDVVEPDATELDTGELNVGPKV